MKKSTFPISKICERHATQVALISDKRTFTYRELNDWILRVSAGLRQNGIGKGDRIALISENSVYLPPLIFALFNLGAIVVPVNFRFPSGQIRELLHALRCRKVFIAGKYHEYQTVISLPVLSIEDFFRDLKQIKFKSDSVDLPLDQTATIIFTSGSSGKPKAAINTIGNHYYNALGANENIRLQPGDRWLLSLPLFHVGGLAILFRTILAGATCVLTGNRKKVSKIILDQQITHISLVATQLIRLLSESKTSRISSRLKAILLGGGSSADNLVNQSLKSHLPLYLSYGLTEMASQVTTTKRLIYNKTLNHNNAGQILKYRQLKISKQGEIWVKGSTLFKGYIRKQRTYLPVNKNGWFHTGDLGRFDSRGNLVISGRRDNMFICGGENIYPEEIEQHLKNIKQIQDVMIVPVADREFGLRPVAFIKFVKGAKIRAEQLRAYLQKKIARYKIPLFFLPWPRDYVALKPQRKDFMVIARQYINSRGGKKIR